MEYGLALYLRSSFVGASMKGDSLGDRMKRYEGVWQTTLPERLPIIIRLDGKAFHSLKLEKPFDAEFQNCMLLTMKELLREVPSTVLAYTQSDEISLLLWPWKKLTSQAWFDNNQQKLVSISASVASVSMTTSWRWSRLGGISLLFDSRAFCLPRHEVVNYLIWRQQDWQRNSLQMLARSLYSHKELHGKGREELHEMLHAKGANWAALHERWKNGLTMHVAQEDPDLASGLQFIENRALVEGLMLEEGEE